MNHYLLSKLYYYNVSNNNFFSQYYNWNNTNNKLIRYIKKNSILPGFKFKLLSAKFFNSIELRNKHKLNLNSFIYRRFFDKREKHNFYFLKRGIIESSFQLTHLQSKFKKKASFKSKWNKLFIPFIKHFSNKSFSIPVNKFTLNNSNIEFNLNLTDIFLQSSLFFNKAKDFKHYYFVKNNNLLNKLYIPYFNKPTISFFENHLDYLWNTFVYKGDDFYLNDTYSEIFYNYVVNRYVNFSNMILQFINDGNLILYYQLLKVKNSYVILTTTKLFISILKNENVRSQSYIDYLYDKSFNFNDISQAIFLKGFVKNKTEDLLLKQKLLDLKKEFVLTQVPQINNLDFKVNSFFYNKKRLSLRRNEVRNLIKTDYFKESGIIEFPLFVSSLVKRYVNLFDNSFDHIRKTILFDNFQRFFIYEM